MQLRESVQSGAGSLEICLRRIYASVPPRSAAHFLFGICLRIGLERWSLQAQRLGKARERFRVLARLLFHRRIEGMHRH